MIFWERKGEGTNQLLLVLIALAAMLACLILSGLRVVQQYEHGVLFILGGFCDPVVQQLQLRVC